MSPDVSNHVTRYDSLFQSETQFPDLYPKEFGSGHLPSPLYTSDTRVTTESVHLELLVTGQPIRRVPGTALSVSAAFLASRSLPDPQIKQICP